MIQYPNFLKHKRDTSALLLRRIWQDRNGSDLGGSNLVLALLSEGLGPASKFRGAIACGLELS